MKRPMLFITLLAMFLGFLGGLPAEAESFESIYGHVSFVEGTPRIIRAQKEEFVGVVNLPVVPGDLIVTGGTDRCEIQFDNGTVMRLDHNSDLKVVTVLAKSLTSKWKLTTLLLESGNLYTLSQTYDKEQFQVITPNAAVKFTQNAAATISVNKEGETSVFTEKGNVHVKYGPKYKQLDTHKVKGGEGVFIDARHTLTAHNKRDIDFLSWNQYIDRNFKELHYGISMLPKKIYKYSRGVVNWAEKWSCRYGEWIYDDLFGYVWRPYDEQFALASRPFEHARFASVNNRVFLIPTQPWGWAPAHMGTWVWLDRGWTWIPGDAFNTYCYDPTFPNSPMLGFGYFPWECAWGFGGFPYSSMWGCGEYLYPNMMAYWFGYVYGGYDQYCEYRDNGIRHWWNRYRPQYKHSDHKAVHKDTLLAETHLENAKKKMPPHIRAIFDRLDKTPMPKVKQWLAQSTIPVKTPFTDKSFSIKERMVRPVVDVSDQPGVVKTSVPKLTLSTALTLKTGGNPFKKENLNKFSGLYYRDWNPDKKWTTRIRSRFSYAPGFNSVIVPRLQIKPGTSFKSSRDIIHKAIGNYQRGRVVDSTGPGGGFGFSGGGGGGGSSSGGGGGGSSNTYSGNTNISEVKESKGSASSTL